MTQARSVLLIDDNADARFVVSLMLEEIGHAVTSCSSVAEAVAHLSTGAAFDVVVTDFVMPDTSGLELATLVRRWQPKTPVVLMTGDQDAIQTALDEGVMALLKPFTLEQLRAVVKEALRQPD